MEQRYTVVVAEDEELQLTSLVKRIHALDLGFAVVGKAQTGQEAYELVKEHTPDLLITDIRMPVMTGIELMEKVRERFPWMPFLIISGFSDFSYAQSAIRLRAEEYLLKPVDPDELAAALQSVKTRFLTEQETYQTMFNPELAAKAADQIASSLKEYILAHYAEDVNLNLIANNMHYSPGYLTKIFLQQYETTPSKFIVSLRTQKAQQLLTHHPELSIRQIGEAVGYPEQGYFSRVFKKQTGASPAEYRQT